jgi:hypothetical protein
MKREYLPYVLSGFLGSSAFGPTVLCFLLLLAALGTYLVKQAHEDVRHDLVDSER